MAGTVGKSLGGCSGDEAEPELRGGAPVVLSGDRSSSADSDVDEEPIIEITDADYRCVWRPCPALEEREEQAHDAYVQPSAAAPGSRQKSRIAQGTVRRRAGGEGR